MSQSRVITLHPTALQRYLTDIEVLAASLADHGSTSADRGPIKDAFRNLAERVIVHPKGPYQGVDVEVRGQLAALIGGDIFPDKVRGIGGSGGRT